MRKRVKAEHSAHSLAKITLDDGDVDILDSRQIFLQSFDPRSRQIECDDPSGGYSRRFDSTASHRIGDRHALSARRRTSIEYRFAGSGIAQLNGKLSLGILHVDRTRFDHLGDLRPMSRSNFVVVFP